MNITAKFQELITNKDLICIFTVHSGPACGKTKHSDTNGKDISIILVLDVKLKVNDEKLYNMVMSIPGVKSINTVVAYNKTIKSEYAQRRSDAKMMIDGLCLPGVSENLKFPDFWYDIVKVKYYDSALIKFHIDSTDQLFDDLIAQGIFVLPDGISLKS